MAQNMVQMAFWLNKYSSCRIHSLPPFYIKTNLHENRFFAARWAIGGKNRSHNVNILAENWTERLWYVRGIDNGTKSMYAYNSLGERLQGLH